MKRCGMALALALACAILVPVPAGAQAPAASPAAVIEYASGDDLAVIRDSKLVPVPDPFGFPLLVGDQVQTGRGVFIELRMVQGDAILKLSENTTFVIRRADSGQTSLALVYGRLRAKVEKLAGTDSFSVAGSSAVAGVRGTDFGMDIVAPRSAPAQGGSFAADPVTSVYCFEGSVEVTALIDTAASVAEQLEPLPQRFAISAGEMVVVSRTEDKRRAEKAELSEPILRFWSDNDFSKPEDAGFGGGSAAAVEPPTATPAQESAATADDRAQAALAEAWDEGYSTGFQKGYVEGASIAAPAGIPSGYLSPEEGRRLESAVRAQRGGMAASGLIVLAGTLLSGAGIALQANGNPGGESLLNAGVIVTGAAIPFLLAAMGLGD